LVRGFVEVLRGHVKKLQAQGLLADFKIFDSLVLCAENKRNKNYFLAN